jgi:tagatose 1,6-diphosphate aldolase
MPTLTLGKIRALQQLANEAGVFTISALDHRGDFVKSLEAMFGTKITWQMVVREKERLLKVLAPHSSAILLDPQYGAGAMIAGGLLPGSVGLMIAREKSGYTLENQSRTTVLLDDWSVEKIKRIGAAAVKLLLFYHPQAANARDQEAIVSRLAEECQTYDIPLLVEPICYPLEPDQAKTGPEFAAQRPNIVLETARRLVPLGIDVLKAEFPTEASYQPHQVDSLMREYCRQLTAAIDIPWVLLSAGVEFATFQKQVEIACEAGASGFLAGRAIWQEAIHMPNEVDRDHFLNTVAVSRLRILNDIAGYRARPWTQAVPAETLPHIEEGWYAQY